MSNCIPMVFIRLEKNCNFSQLTFKAMQHFFAITPYCPCNTVIMFSIESNYKKTTTLHLLFNFFLYQIVNMQMNFYLVKSVTFLTIIARHQSMYIFL